MKKKTIKIELDNHSVEENIDDLLTFQEISELKSKLTFCDVLDKRQLRRVKRFIKELQNREVINYEFVLEYFKTITHMRRSPHNLLNESSELITIHDYFKKTGPQLQLYCFSK